MVQALKLYGGFMLSSKIETMKPLLQLVNGLHLTVYIKNRGDLSDIRSQIRDALDLAESYLVQVLSPTAMAKYLAPLHLLQKDTKRLKSFKGSIGLFRTENSFRALSLPVEVEPSCIVADTFHVKPLLKWIQLDREFLLLGLESNSASLYQGDLNTLKQIETVAYPEVFRGAKGRDLHQSSVRSNQYFDTMEWLNGWIMNTTFEVRPRLFVAGKRELTQPLLQMLQYENSCSVPVWGSFSQEQTAEICSQIRSVLRLDARKSFERALVEFHYAVDVNQATGNLFTIAKAAVRGKIKKLLIADGIQIFGKLNRKSGDLKLNGRDLDHEDDDVLDDIAQTVLAHGGEVTIATSSEIPKGRSSLARVDEPLPVAVSHGLDLNGGSDHFRRL